jgi:hypothetical protein
VSDKSTLAYIAIIGLNAHRKHVAQGFEQGRNLTECLHWLILFAAESLRICAFVVQHCTVVQARVRDSMESSSLSKLHISYRSLERSLHVLAEAR